MLKDVSWRLRGGLDLQTPRIGRSRRPGALALAINYEPHPLGYRRIDGYERYDGQPSPSNLRDRAQRDAARERIQQVPGKGRILGLHFYKDTLYAFRQNATDGYIDVHKATPNGWKKIELHSWMLVRTYANDPKPDAYKDIVLTGGTSSVKARFHHAVLVEETIDNPDDATKPFNDEIWVVSPGPIPSIDLTLVTADLGGGRVGFASETNNLGLSGTRAVGQTISYPSNRTFGGGGAGRIALEFAAGGRVEITESALLPDGDPARFLNTVWINESGLVEVEITSDQTENQGQAGDRLSEDWEDGGRIIITPTGRTHEGSPDVLTITLTGSDKTDPYAFRNLSNEADVIAWMRRNRGFFNETNSSATVRLEVDQQDTTIAGVSSTGGSLEGATGKIFGFWRTPNGNRAQVSTDKSITLTSVTIGETDYALERQAEHNNRYIYRTTSRLNFPSTWRDAGGVTVRIRRDDAALPFLNSSGAWAADASGSTTVALQADETLTWDDKATSTYPKVRTVPQTSRVGKAERAHMHFRNHNFFASASGLRFYGTTANGGQGKEVVAGHDAFEISKPGPGSDEIFTPIFIAGRTAADPGNAFTAQSVDTSVTEYVNEIPAIAMAGTSVGYITGVVVDNLGNVTVTVSARLNSLVVARSSITVTVGSHSFAITDLTGLDTSTTHTFGPIAAAITTFTNANEGDLMTMRFRNTEALTKPGPRKRGPPKFVPNPEQVPGDPKPVDPTPGLLGPGPPDVWYQERGPDSPGLSKAGDYVLMRNNVPIASPAYVRYETEEVTIVYSHNPETGAISTNIPAGSTREEGRLLRLRDRTYSFIVEGPMVPGPPADYILYRQSSISSAGGASVTAPYTQRLESGEADVTVSVNPETGAVTTNYPDGEAIEGAVNRAVVIRLSPRSVALFDSTTFRTFAPDEVDASPAYIFTGAFPGATEPFSNPEVEFDVPGDVVERNFGQENYWPRSTTFSFTSVLRETLTPGVARPLVPGPTLPADTYSTGYPGASEAADTTVTWPGKGSVPIEGTPVGGESTVAGDPIPGDYGLPMLFAESQNTKPPDTPERRYYFRDGPLVRGAPIDHPPLEGKPVPGPDLEVPGDYVDGDPVPIDC